MGPVIDFHSHIWDDPKQVHSIIEQMDRVGVDQVCLSSLTAHYPTEEQITRSNQQVAQCIEWYPKRVLGFCYLNPRHGNFSLAELKKAKEEWGMVGIKLWVSCLCTDEAVKPILQKAAEYKMPVLIHTFLKQTGNLPFESKPEDVAQVAVDNPDVAFVMAHLGGDWERGCKTVQYLQNVWTDTSGSIAQLGMIEKAVKTLGSNRVLFGSDAPVDLAFSYAKVQGSMLTEDEKEAVFGKNALRLLFQR